MSIKYNTTEITPKYPNVELTKVYHQTTVVWESSHYQIDEVIFEQATAGTYSLDLLDTGKYEVYCVAGGGGAVLTNNGQNMVMAAGASGSGFIGVLQINKGNYTIIVGKAGPYVTAHYVHPKGGESSISNIILCPSQKETSLNNYNWGAHKNDGPPVIYVNKISKTLNKAGNDATTVSGLMKGGDSVYNGYGTGGGFTGSILHPTRINSSAGYVKIVYKGS